MNSNFIEGGSRGLERQILAGYELVAAEIKDKVPKAESVANEKLEKIMSKKKPNEPAPEPPPEGEAKRELKMALGEDDQKSIEKIASEGADQVIAEI